MYVVTCCFPTKFTNLTCNWCLSLEHELESTFRMPIHQPKQTQRIPKVAALNCSSPMSTNSNHGSPLPKWVPFTPSKTNDEKNHENHLFEKKNHLNHPHPFLSSKPFGFRGYIDRHPIVTEWSRSTSSGIWARFLYKVPNDPCFFLTSTSHCRQTSIYSNPPVPPSAWLCQAGKISGTPWASEQLKREVSKKTCET